MISLGNNRFLCETVEDLPRLGSFTELFLDVETTQRSVFETKTKWTGMYPFKGDRIAGYAFSVDDEPEVFYIPVRHVYGSNIPLDPAIDFARRLVTETEQWINHNVCFDAVFMTHEGAEFDCELVDTLTLSKVHDSDRLGHDLKSLSADWLEKDLSAKNALDKWLTQAATSDYGRAPADICGEYACEDVQNNRELYRFLQNNRAEGLEGIWETEKLLTPVLYDMEMDGLRIVPKECRIEAAKAMREMIRCAEVIADLTGTEFTNSNACIYDILINQFGMPVLATKKERNDLGRLVDTGRPTFDKDAMPLYLVHPRTKFDPKLREVLEAIQTYRDESQFNGLFASTFLEMHDDDCHVHPTYNQVVRTGRMSCSRPNAQQQNKRSKKLIKPHKGYGFISCDYSQIEYRLIVHYIKDEDAIRAYLENPDTDFHQWVADMLHVDRKLGKIMNFGMAYGQGKAGVTAKLAGSPLIMEEMGDEIDRMLANGLVNEEDKEEAYGELCEQRASEVHESYHERFPRLKRTSRQAASTCRRRGYVFNAYGRRRHLPPKASRKAFNSIIQGCAMDIIKERMIALSPRYNERSREIGLKMSANVHDEVLTQVPVEVLYDREVHLHKKRVLESPNIDFRVPMYVDMGVSPNDWAEAAGDDVVEKDGEFIGGPVDL